MVVLRYSVSQHNEQLPNAYQTKSIKSGGTGTWKQFCLKTISSLNSGGSDYERMTCAKCLHQPFQQWELTDKKKTDTNFFLAKKRVQAQSVLIFVSPVSSNGRIGWNVSLKGEPYVLDNPGLFGSHGFLRRATTREKRWKLVWFTGYVVKGHWEIWNMKFCLKRSRFWSWNIFSLQECHLIRPAKNFQLLLCLQVCSDHSDAMVSTLGDWNKACSTQGKSLTSAFSGFTGTVHLQYWNCLQFKLGELFFGTPGKKHSPSLH